MKPLMLTALVLMGCADNAQNPTDGPPVNDTIQTADRPTRLQSVASGLSNPVHLTAPANDQRLFIVEQPGRIRIVQNGQLLSTPFLDIVSKVLSGGERGLLSLAFHPQYASNGYFFVNYTGRNSGETRVERYRVSSDPNRADAASATLILQIAQPYSNHNGGHILFGPDGMLYVAMGDGGDGGDPHNHGQDRTTLLGDLLRINVNGATPYTIPTDNPFSGMSSARNEIWAYGLRNPWRIAFDRVDNVLYIADVGQNRIEEINAVPARTGGLNYGWRIMEGSDCYNASSCTRTSLTLPVAEYSHSEGCSVTGGIVYRGRRFTGIQGHYFYSDYCQGWIRSFRYSNGQVTNRQSWSLGDVDNVLSYGEDASGEMYILSSNGTVYRFAN
jgi:glucose/arabinose dehydrogenase